MRPMLISAMRGWLKAAGICWVALSSCSDDSSTEQSGSSGSGGSGGTAGAGSQSTGGGGNGHGGTSGASLDGGGSAGGSTGGSGAQAGNGGSGGSSQDWLLSDDWDIVPELGFTGPEDTCYLAKPDSIQFPALEWKSCGTGCSEADLVLGDSSVLGASISTVVDEVGNARPALYGAYYLTAGYTHVDLMRFVTLDDGVTTSVLGCRRPVGTSGVTIRSAAVSESARAAVVVKSSSTAQLDLRGRPPMDRQHSWVWASPVQNETQMPPIFDGMDTDESGGRVFGLGAGVVVAQLDPTSSTWTTIENPSTSVRGAGQGDLAVWFDRVVDGSVLRERIRCWNQNTGLQTLVESMPGVYQLGVDVSPTRIVGAVSDTYEEDTRNVKIHFWQTPRAYDVSQVSIFQLTDIPMPDLQAGSYLVRTWGKYAATLVNQVSDSNPDHGYYVSLRFVYVADLDTGKSWRIVPTAGHDFLGDLTITESHLYVGELKTPDSNSTSSVLRIDLDKLDTAGQPL